MSSRASAWLSSIYYLVMWGELHSLCLTIHIFKKMVITLTQSLPEVVSGINRDHLYKVLNMAFGPWKGVISSQLAWFFHIQYLCAHSTMQSEATEYPHFCVCEFKNFQNAKVLIQGGDTWKCSKVTYFCYFDGEENTVFSCHEKLFSWMKAEEPKEPRVRDKNSKEGNRDGKIQMSLLRATNGVTVSKLLVYWF